MHTAFRAYILLLIKKNKNMSRCSAFQVKFQPFPYCTRPLLAIYVYVLFCVDCMSERPNEWGKWHFTNTTQQQYISTLGSSGTHTHTSILQIMNTENLARYRLYLFLMTSRILKQSLSVMLKTLSFFCANSGCFIFLAFCSSFLFGISRVRQSFAATVRTAARV